jgi:hypothetical protein
MFGFAVKEQLIDPQLLHPGIYQGFGELSHG